LKPQRMALQAAERAHGGRLQRGPMVTGCPQEGAWASGQGRKAVRAHGRMEHGRNRRMGYSLHVVYSAALQDAVEAVLLWDHCVVCVRSVASTRVFAKERLARGCDGRVVVDESLEGTEGGGQGGGQWGGQGGHLVCPPVAVFAMESMGKG
jgi:hypothetical protein